MNFFNNYIKKFYNYFFFFNINFFYIYFNWNKYLKTGDLINLYKLSLKPNKIKTIDSDNIYFFHDQINYLKDRVFFFNNNLKVKNSPQVFFLKYYQFLSSEKLIGSKIYNFYRFKNKKINFFNNRIIYNSISQKIVFNKINRIKKIYNSIKRNGYLKNEYIKSYPCVIKYGYNYLFNKNFKKKIFGYEILVGHRRISSLVALNKKYIKVIVLEKL
jgi:hypothetical protein